MNNNEKKLLDRALELQQKIEGFKDVYAEMDQITLELRSCKFKQAIHKGKTIQIVDNFKKKNVCYRATGIKRFELKIDE